MMKRMLAALAVLLLAGCQMTVVEHLPDGATTECNTDWRGAWIGIEDDQGDGDTGIFVAADCKVTVIPGDPGPKDREVTLTPRFLPGVVLFADSEVQSLLQDDMKAHGHEDTWFPFGWSRSGDVLELEAPDHRRIATLIVNGGIDGITQWEGRDSGYNLIRGEPAELRVRLTQGGLFADDDPIRLRRVGDDRKDVDRALKKAVRAKERGR